ncbi:hypothetical protein Y1Q_0002831 [Alligator mississippiensis]|uniref:Reverse transcriptase RNase H-like domain-containing protein n=1 Tax=Alligator mississippiensis TaxID=8496 RepID=A0A151NZA5_ALLMI|nr:hypothetical protein Y1Q_0002831 [Alligator mississippiensis]
MQLAAMASLDVTDASETAIGAVLTQEDDGLDRPIAYASWKLLPMETWYATIERECLAIRCATEHFRYYLMGREFKLMTDHAPLKWLSTAKTDNARITSKELQFTLVILQGWHNKSSNCHESSGPFLSGEKSEVQTEPAREKQGSMGPCWEARDCMIFWLKMPFENIQFCCFGVLKG